MPQLDAEPVELAVLRDLMPPEQQLALDTIASVYGKNTDALINGLMDMTVRSAILAGVSPENFAAGMKHTWDAYAQVINRAKT